MGAASASVVVMCLAADPDAARALAGLSAALREPQEHCRIVSLQSFVAGYPDGLGPQDGWAESFAARYLDAPLIYAELPDPDSETLRDSERTHPPSETARSRWVDDSMPGTVGCSWLSSTPRTHPSSRSTG